MNKKAISPIIFTWIFVLIAGALILTFFISFSFQHIKLSKEKNSAQLALNLDNQLEAFGISEDSNKKIDLALESNLNFDCDSITAGNFKNPHDKIIFSPSQLQSTQIYAWTEAFNFPYKIANFYYLGNEKTKIILVYDSASYNFVNTLQIPELFDVKTISISYFQPEQNKNADIIYFTQSAPSNSIQVNPNIHEITINNKKTFYLNSEQLYGLFFTKENYECLLQKTLKKLEDVSEIYSQKSYYLSLKTTNPLCKSKLANARSTLSQFKTLKQYSTLTDFKERIEILNKDLEKNDCSTLY